MPQASEELRAMFEDDAEASWELERRGWTCDRGWWTLPPGLTLDEAFADDRAFCAVAYLHDEWDHAVRGVHDVPPREA